MSKTYIWCFSAVTDQLTHKLILNIILQIYRSTTADIYIYIYCYHCGSVSFIKFSRIVVIVCFFFLLLFVVPVVSGWAGLCSRGLQDRLLRTMAAISSSMSTSSGLLWLQDGRVSLLEDMRSRAVTGLTEAQWGRLTFWGRRCRRRQICCRRRTRRRDEMKARLKHHFARGQADPPHLKVHLLLHTENTPEREKTTTAHCDRLTHLSIKSNFFSEEMKLLFFVHILK